MRPDRRRSDIQLEALDVLRELLPMLPVGPTSGAVARARRLVAEADAEAALERQPQFVALPVVAVD